MIKSNIIKFLIRFTFVFLTHVMIKAGDYTLDVFDTSTRSILFSLYFITLWMLVWYAASYVNTKIKKSQDKYFFPYILFAFNFVFSFLSAFSTNYLYRIGDIMLFNNAEAWENIKILNPELTISLLVMYMVVFFFDIYFTSVINKKDNQLQLAKLKAENTLSKYLNLKHQIEPHFLFNSLSVLSSIIHSDANLASDFVLKLSKILRYVIEKNEMLTVSLKDEISFIDDYFFLIKTRFDDGIIIENNIDKELINTCVIPPVSLQLLFENAIKHNKFTSENPLKITMYNNNNYIIVRNNINIRTDVVDSTKQGLDNLTKRFSFLAKIPVKIEITNNEFIVSLPILKNKDNESFNI